jgi:hypothetical protein
MEVWTALFIAIARIESDTRFTKAGTTHQRFDPRAYRMESDGKESLGLLQIGYNASWKKTNWYNRYASAHNLSLAGMMHETKDGLYDPPTNLKCGVLMFAALIGRRHNIAGGRNDKGEYALGADMYWSTLRGKNLEGIKKTVRDFALKEARQGPSTTPGPSAQSP